jgi:hypothetical protein
MNFRNFAIIIASSLIFNLLNGLYAVSGSFEDALKQKEAERPVAKAQITVPKRSFEIEQEAHLQHIKREVPKNIEHIQKGLQDHSLYPMDTEDMSVEDLGYARDSRAVPVLVQVLKGYPLVIARAKAAEALGRIGDKSAIPDLENALTDKDYQVRLAAATALVDLREFEAAFPTLAEIALGKNAGNWELDLSRSGDYTRQIFIEVVLRGKAIGALCNIKNDDAMKILRACLDDKRIDIQIAACGGLAGTKYDSLVIPIIKDVIFNGKYYVWERNSAISILAKTHDPSAMAIIEGLTTNNDPRVSRAAKGVLKRNKGKQ